MRAMQTLKGAAPATFAARNERAAALGLSPRDYLSLGQFANALEPIGVKTTGITKGPFNQGCLLKLSGKAGQYEVHLDGNGSITLGRMEKDGQRVRLYAGSTATEAGWDRLLAAIRNSEGRA